jgi:hypothetical protein
MTQDLYDVMDKLERGEPDGYVDPGIFTRKKLADMDLTIFTPIPKTRYTLITDSRLRYFCIADNYNTEDNYQIDVWGRQAGVEDIHINFRADNCWWDNDDRHLIYHKGLSLFAALIKEVDRIKEEKRKLREIT